MIKITRRRKGPLDRRRERDLKRSPLTFAAMRERAQKRAHLRRKHLTVHSSAEAALLKPCTTGCEFNIINLSSRVLTTQQRKLLGRGLSFVPKPKRILKDRLLSEFKQFVRKLRLMYMFRGVPKRDSRFRRKGAYTPGPTGNKTLESFIVQAEDQLSSLDFEVNNAGGRRPRGSNLTFGERRALEELAADNTIVINKADKANVIVVRNHTDYAAEGFVHLSDAAVYRELPYDTTLEVEHLVTGFVQKLFKQGLINEEMAKFCLPNKNLRTARIYFLKKTDKTDSQWNQLSH